MILLAHRGCWKKEAEQNTPIAFRRSFNLGFGAECDVRDYCGKLVVSHDIANSKSMNFEKLLEIYSHYEKQQYLGINIKADGIQKLLFKILNEYKIENYFVFDMSTPDTIGYFNLNMKVFTRESEHETAPPFYKQSIGILMDEFSDHWITNQKIQHHLNSGKKVCIVSPELHEKDHLTIWKEYKELSHNLNTDNLMLCTDFPEEAKKFYED